MGKNSKNGKHRNGKTAEVAAPARATQAAASGGGWTMNGRRAAGEITLEQFCRALAAHLLLGSHPGLLQSVMAPDTA
jgi:hypothetical protein